MKKEILVKNKKRFVSLNNPVYRYSDNPILTPSEINKVWISPKLQVVTCHNAGVCKFKGETLLLFRSHLRNGLSVIGLAKSKNGFDNWKIEPKPVLKPATLEDKFAHPEKKEEYIEEESGGVEDPRIIKIQEEYVITYSAYHAKIKDRVRASIATTKDFKTFTRYGHVLKTNMRNMVLFPEKIKNRYYALFRINDKKANDLGGKFAEIRIGSSSNFKHGNWKVSKTPIMKTGHGPSAIQDKIGPGAPPIKTKHGWLNIFHGVRKTTNENPYVLSVALHDLNNPEKVRMSNIPILFPTQSDCKVPNTQYIHVPQVVFTCGALRNKKGEILIYYGGNDTVMNLCVTHEDILAELCNKYQQNTKTGERLY